MIDSETASCSSGACVRLTDLLSAAAPGCLQLRTPSQATGSPDVVLLRAARSDTLPEVVESLRRRWATSRIVGVLCGGWDNVRDTARAGLEALDDFFFCPFRELEVGPRIRRLLTARTPAGPPAAESFYVDHLVGRSAPFRDVIEKLARVSASDATVLVSGETGTGKELFARVIHYRSTRAAKPFIPVNCGCLPDHLFENEVFGHSKGAYTDASTSERGLLAIADGGSVLFDEIDSLSPSAQTKLLRFLQEKEYRPLGSAHTVMANVRVIAATNTDLRARVKAKTFREDLFYRLNVLSLPVPPLRDRLDDIPLLAAHFLERFARQYNRKTLRFSSTALLGLSGYSWPGNVRELESVIHKAVVMTHAEELQPSDLELAAPAPAAAAGGSLREAKNRAVEQFEKVYLSNLLASHDGNVTRAARTAGKERRAFQRLIRKHSLFPEDFRA